MCAIMPAALAAADPEVAVPGLIGSGPFSYAANRREPGKRVVYERYAPYVPNVSPPSGDAGPKDVYLDAVEWLSGKEPDAVAADLASGAVDWWQAPPPALVRGLGADPGLVVRPVMPEGLIAALRINPLHPPFDKPAVRRALLGAVSQAEYMLALNGKDGPAWQDRVGIFSPGSTYASEEGMAALTDPRDEARSRRDLEAAGYKGETVTVLVRADSLRDVALAAVTEGLLQRLGMGVKMERLDGPAFEARRRERKPPSEGGWSLHHATIWPEEQRDPVGHTLLRGGAAGAPASTRIEAMVENWVRAPDQIWRKRIAAQIQRVALDEVPYIPLGQTLAPSAWRAELKAPARIRMVFWNIPRR
jgi:peptide/nickel transport system substrate-binding protein